MTAAVPLTSSDFSLLLTPLLPSPTPAMLAVAVSGGADSLALVLLAAHFVRAHGIALTALTVDHGLRPESSKEAAQVAVWMQQQHIAHQILKWNTTEHRGNLQLAAREARYALMDAWCRKNAIHHLLVAHHRDDQAETVLLRLKRGSHVRGLAAMQPVSRRGALTVLRPLLPVPKSRLVATLEALNLPWIEDPSNRNMSFDRVRARILLKQLPASDTHAGALAGTATRLLPLRQAYEASLNALLSQHVTRTDAGMQTSLTVLESSGEELTLAALALLLQQTGQQLYPPRYSEVEALYAALRATPRCKRTLGGCIVERHDDRLHIYRERA
jgi:tRNA(Ile)-lysidine synthase